MFQKATLTTLFNTRFVMAMHAVAPGFYCLHTMTRLMSNNIDKFETGSLLHLFQYEGRFIFATSVCLFMLKHYI